MTCFGDIIALYELLGHDGSIISKQFSPSNTIRYVSLHIADL